MHCKFHYNKLLYFLISRLLICWSDTGVACGLSSVLSGGKILNTNEVGTLNAGYDLTYTYQGSTGHKFQLANVRDVNYRTEGTPTDSTNINNGHKYEYDLNGNLVYINTSRVKRDGKEDEKATEQKFKWDEENRLLAADENGFVSNYWYDADGERTVKTSGEGEQIYVNSEFAGGRTNTAKFSLYVSPYLVANQGGRYTKHIYIGSQRIVSKIGDFASYGSDPRRIAYAGSEADAVTVDYMGKYSAQQQVIKDNYATFNVPYNGEDNNDYVDGEGFCCNDGTPEAAQAKAMAANVAGAKAISGNFKENDDYEKMQFYYHPDHLGSSSYITNLDDEVAQHIEYVPFGEVFIEERNNTWNTPYLFNAKEFDEETGLYYYGARYYEPRLSLWMSCDPMQEKYPAFTSYAYTSCNPLRFVDPTGMVVETADEQSQINIQNTLSIDEAKYVKFVNGVLDNDLLNKSESNSENMIALKALSNSDISYVFATGSEYTSNGEPKKLVGDDKSGTKGITLIPGAETDPSPDNSVYIFTSEALSKERQASNTAHEGYGHAYFYELQRQGQDVDPYHHYIPILLPPEYDAELGMEVPVLGRQETNIKLQKQIQVVEKQAMVNYKSRKQ